MIVACGSYTGGELRYYPNDDGKKALEELDDKESDKLDINCKPTASAVLGENTNTVSYSLRLRHFHFVAGVLRQPWAHQNPKRPLRFRQRNQRISPDDADPDGHLLDIQTQE